MANFNTSRDVDAYFLGNVASGSLPLLLGEDILAAYGPVEAVQKFVVRLFTRRGSVLADPDRGTDLMRLLRTGKLRSEAELSMAFNSAAHDVLLSLAYDQGSGGDPDELPVSAQLLGVDISPDAVRFSVSIMTAAGRLISFDLPFSK